MKAESAMEMGPWLLAQCKRYPGIKFHKTNSSSRRMEEGGRLVAPERGKGGRAGEGVCLSVCSILNAVRYQVGRYGGICSCQFVKSVSPDSVFCEHEGAVAHNTIALA